MDQVLLPWMMRAGILLDTAGAVTVTWVAATLVPHKFREKIQNIILPTAYMPIGVGIPQWWHRGIAIGRGDGHRPVCRHS